MNIYTHPEAHPKAHLQDAQRLADGINQLNAQRTHRAEAGAQFVVVLVVGILGGLALLHFLTPCEAAALCGMTAIPTRPNWAQRLGAAAHVAWLRWRVRAAQQDIMQMEQAIDQAQAEMIYLPEQIKLHQLWIDTHSAMADSIALGNRAA